MPDMQTRNEELYGPPVELNRKRMNFETFEVTEEKSGTIDLNYASTTDLAVWFHIAVDEKGEHLILGEPQEGESKRITLLLKADQLRQLRDKIDRFLTTFEEN